MTCQPPLIIKLDVEKLFFFNQLCHWALQFSSEVFELSTYNLFKKIPD